MTRKELFEKFEEWEVELPTVEEIQKEMVPSEIEENFREATGLKERWEETKKLILQCIDVDFLPFARWTGYGKCMRLHFGVGDAACGARAIEFPNVIASKIPVETTEVLDEKELFYKQIEKVCKEMDWREFLQLISELVDEIYTAARERYEWLNEDIER